MKRKHDNTREAMIIALSHKHLGPGMLERLCKTNVCFECYFELAVAAYKDTVTSSDDVKRAIELLIRSPFSEMLPELVKEMSVIEISDADKKDVLNTYAQMYGVL